MGCCEQKSQEQAFQNIFKSLKIRDTSLNKFLSDVKSSQTNDENFITENQFQEIINTYLLTSKVDTNTLNEFWFEFYTNIPYKDKYVTILLCLGLLSKGGSEKEEIEFYKDLFSNNNMNDTDYMQPQSSFGFDKENTNAFNFYSKNELVNYMSRYIELITYKAVSHFKYFSYDSDQFEKKKLHEWNPLLLEMFVNKYLFEVFEEALDKRQLIPLDDFFKENLEKLKDDDKIRKEYAEFSTTNVPFEQFEFTPLD